MKSDNGYRTMTTYIFDNTLDGLLTAVFDSFALHQQPQLLAEGEQLPLFADEPHRVVTDETKTARVWKGIEKHLSREALRIISISWMSEERTLNQPLFNYICKVFLAGKDLSHNASDPDVLAVRNTCRRVLHEEQRMKQFIRFQKAKDGTYLAVVAPDHNVLPLIIDHFQDRFNDQSWLIYDARRHYGYYYGSPSLSPTHRSLRQTKTRVLSSASPSRTRPPSPLTSPTANSMSPCSAPTTNYSRTSGAPTSRPSASASASIPRNNSTTCPAATGAT